MSAGIVDAAPFPIHARSLTSPRQANTWLAWHGIVWEGVHVPYHLCHILDPIYPPKKLPAPMKLFFST